MGLFIISLLLIASGIIIFSYTKKRNMKDNRLKWGGLGTLILGGILFISSMVVVVDAGEMGVIILFGKVQHRYLNNGIHLVYPFSRIVLYPVRLREFSLTEHDSVETRVNNGLSISLDSTTFYSINPEMAGYVYTHVADSIDTLEENILMPTIRTVIRSVCSSYSAEEIYGSKRDAVTGEIKEAIVAMVSNKGIVIDNFLIRAIKLPDEIDKAIQAKISAQQEAETMEFIKQKAIKEAEIKIIEAQGLAEAQRIINSTLSPNYIQHEAIEAYKQLAGSPNTTFVIMPTSASASGMPLILNATH